MKIAVLFASNRHGGKHKEIRYMIDSLNLPFTFDFIELADYDIPHCMQDCSDCVIKTEYRCLHDNDTEIIIKKLIDADMNLIVVPLYFPYPSKFTALMEKLLKLCYRTENRPLKNKPTALFLYCSVKIVDETPLKILWQQYLMDDGYSFNEINYPYLNSSFNDELNYKYNNDITAYIKEFLFTLDLKAKLESRCGLLCSECGFRESCNCGECPDIPQACGVSDCKKKDTNDFTHCDTCDKTTCGKLHAYSYTDPDHGDNPPGARVEQYKKWAKESNDV